MLSGEKGKMKSNQGSRQQMGWARGEQEISPGAETPSSQHRVHTVELRATWPTGPLPGADWENGSSLSLSFNLALCPDVSLLPVR